jgi:hypothetical protein
VALIVFGCSFTNYAWPSWADIMAEDLGCDYENWALGGTGNNAIARRVMSRHFLKFNQDDIVIIQWSFPSREDRFINGSWTTNGSVFNKNGIYGDKFVEKYWDWDNDLINYAHSRVSTAAILEDKLKFQFTLTEHDAIINNMPETSIQKFLNQKLPPLPVFENRPSFNGIHAKDAHPDPLQWLLWLEERIYPFLNLTMKESTRTRVHEYYNKLCSTVEQVYNNNATDPCFIINNFAANLSRELKWRQNKISVGRNDIINSEILF